MTMSTVGWNRSFGKSGSNIRLKPVPVVMLILTELVLSLDFGFMSYDSLEASAGRNIVNTEPERLHLKL